MKKLLITAMIYCPFALFGQTQKTRYPVYFTSGELNSIDSFNSFLFRGTNYHLVQMDSSSYRDWSFTFTNNQVYNGVKDKVHINYEIRAVAGNPSLHQDYVFGVGTIRITGEYLALADIYNKLFDEKKSAGELQQIQNTLLGPLYYRGQSYWLNFEFMNNKWTILLQRK